MKKLLLTLLLIPFLTYADGYKDRNTLQPTTLFETSFAYQGFDCVSTPKASRPVGLLEAIITNSVGSAIHVGIADRLADSEWLLAIVDASATPDTDGTADAGCENSTADDCELIHSGVANNDGATIIGDAQFDVVCANMTSGTNAASTGVMAVQYYNGSSMTAATQLSARTDETDWAVANGRVCVMWRKPHDQVTGCTSAFGAAGTCDGKYVIGLIWTTALDAVVKASQIKVGRLLKSQESLGDNSSIDLNFDPTDTVIPSDRCLMPVFGGASGTTGTNGLNSVFLRYREIE